jgi:hypothetical protein
LKNDFGVTRRWQTKTEPKKTEPKKIESDVDTKIDSKIDSKLDSKKTGNGFLSMAENQELQPTVERAIAQVFADQLPRLQAALTQSVMRNVMENLPAAAPPSNSAASTSLRQLVTNIHAGNTQKDILRALLDGGSAHCERVALFVVKAGTATGWQARGFSDDEAVKDSYLDLNSGPVAHAYRNRVATPANIAEMGDPFAEHFGRPANEQVLWVPLVLKDKVAAMLYADGGSTGALDASSLETLVLVTSAWLELTSLRKQTQKEAVESAFERIPELAPLPAAASFSDPFAAHPPAVVTQHAPEAEPEPAAQVAEAMPDHATPVEATPVEEASAEIMPLDVPVFAHAAAAGAAAATAPAPDPHAQLSPEDADTHRKAQRFARLLVDEIKLYNQAKVAEGRRNKDLYDRLKEDIEKSRSTYQKRYGATAAASGEYFQQEIVRNLAEEDASVMGANFQQ